MKPLFALVALLAFALLFAWTLTLGGSGRYPFLYPQILIGLTTVLMAGLAVGELQAARVRREPETDEAFSSAPILGLLAAAAYVWSWTALGHGPATAAFLVVALLIAGERRPLVLLAFGLAIPVIIQLLFIQALRIPLPRIPWL